MLSEAADLPATAICLNCSYSLRSLPEHRCPECGRPFDPAAPESFWDTRRPRSARLFWRHCAAPPSLAEVVLAALVALVFVPCLAGTFYAFPESDYLFRMTLIALLLGLILLTALRKQALKVCHWSPWNRPERQNRKTRTRWRVIVVCVMVSWAGAVAIIFFPLAALRASSIISRPLLLAKAKGVLATRQTDDSPGLVGLLYVARVIPVRAGVVRFDLGTPSNYVWLFYDEDGYLTRKLPCIPPGIHWKLGDLKSW